MVAVTSVTSCFGTISISINDKDDKTGAQKDFLTSPISRCKLVAGYVLSSAAISLIMTTAALVLCLMYIALIGGNLPGLPNLMRLALTIVLSVLCANAIVFFISLFVKSENAFSALSVIVGTLIGFLMGIYIPPGQLSDSIQWVIKCFPMSHAASMFRQVMADGELTELFAGAPPGALEGFRETFGIVFVYGDFTSSFWFSAMVLLGTAIVFYLLSLIVMRRSRM